MSFVFYGIEKNERRLKFSHGDQLAFQVVLAPLL